MSRNASPRNIIIKGNSNSYNTNKEAEKLIPQSRESEDRHLLEPKLNFNEKGKTSYDFCKQNLINLGEESSPDDPNFSSEMNHQKFLGNISIKTSIQLGDRV